MFVSSQFCLLVLIINGMSSVFAAEWSEWMDLTPCSSKPCECDPPYMYDTICNSKGRKAQIRSCVREEGEMDDCKGGGPFRYVNNCNNRNNCPGWSEWSVVSECDCTTNERKIERLCNNPAPIHPEVLCMRTDATQGTQEEWVEHCLCSASELTPPTSTSTYPPVTTELPWCCEMYIENNDDGNHGNSDYPSYAYDEAQIREARDADDYFYSVYDSICRECSKSNGYSGKHGNSEDDNRYDPLGYI